MLFRGAQRLGLADELRFHSGVPPRRGTCRPRLLMLRLVWVLAAGASCAALWAGVSGASAASSVDGSGLVPTGTANVGVGGGGEALSGDGGTAVVGVAGDDFNHGAAWVFTRSGSGWVQGAELTPTGASSYGGSQFGSSVAISADGNTILVGGPDDSGGTYRPEQAPAGAAWVFVRSGSGWVQQGLALTAPHDSSGPGAFGTSAALSADGDVALVGGGGGAWIFSRSGSRWSASSTLAASDVSGNGNAFFGASVALSADGSTALVGGPTDGVVERVGGGPPLTQPTGAVWTFTRSGAGWLQSGSKLTPPGLPHGEFGWGVALSGDGGTALVSGDGGAWAFGRGGSVWAQQGPQLVPADQGSGGQVGLAVALSSDGSTALLTGSDTSGSDAWLFAKSGAAWAEQGSRIAAATSGTPAAQLSSNGGTLLMGANVFSDSQSVSVAPPVATSTGQVDQPVSASGAGTVTEVATVTSAGVASAARVDATRTLGVTGSGRVVYGRVSATTRRPGRMTLTLKPSRAGRALLARDGSLRVTLVITFNPVTGPAPREQTRSVIVHARHR